MFGFEILAKTNVSRGRWRRGFECAGLQIGHRPCINAR